MPKGYNLYNLEPQFRNFLSAENISPVTLKNYLSDFRHFSGWIELYSKTNADSGRNKAEDTEIDGVITVDSISLYRSYLVENKLPHKTINRRLSTIRKFCVFCISQGWMKENPAKRISNIGQHTEEVSALLSAPKLEPEKPSFMQIGASLGHNIVSSIRKFFRDVFVRPNEPNRFSFGLQHYIAFLIILIFVAILGAGIYNQFFNKSKTSFAYPTTLTKAGRLLSFQGRLTDSLGNPITTATNVSFNLYNVSTGGTALYTAGPCSLTPDQDGIINVLIGGSGYLPTPPTSTYNAVCGSEIDSSIFSENANVYLGVTVASDAEMTPRQQIANVGYAINSETLQGLPPGTDAASIPYINSDGNLLISTSNPDIASTYTSATFTISSANSTTIQSAGSGDVTLQATESGTLKFRTAGGDDTYTRMIVTNTGEVGIGDLTPSATLTVGNGDLFQVAGATGNITTAGDLAVNGGDITTSGTTLNITTADGGTTNFVSGSDTLAAIKDQGTYAFWNLAGKTTTGDPATCSEGDIYYNATDDSIKICHAGNTWEALDGGGSGTSVWSDLLSPTANLLLNMGTYKTEFNWDTGTGTDDLFSLTTDASSNGTGSLVNIQTGTGSTVNPLRVRAGATESLYVNSSGFVGVGTTGPDRKLDVLDASNPQLRLTQADGTTYADLQVDASGNLNIDATGTKTVLADDLQVSGNDILDSGATIRLNLGATTTLTNTTTTLSGTATLNAASLTNFNTAASLAMGSTTALTLGGNSTIYGGSGASQTLTLDSTSDVTKGNLQFFSSSNTLSPTGTLTLAGAINLPNSNSITGVSNYLQLNNGISVGGGTTYYLDTSGNLNANNISTGGTQRISSAGNLTNIGTTQFNGVTYTWPGADGTNGYVLKTNGLGTLSWAAEAGGVNYWALANGSLYPVNSTLDLFIGGTASDSAKFAFINVDSGNPTASISGNLAIAAPTGANPATTYSALNGGTINFQTSVGGDAGLLSRLFIDNNGYVGVGDNTPTALFTVGSGDKFQVDGNGNVIKLNNVDYSWPSSQGAANTVLQNNGSGTLSWYDINQSSDAGPWTVANGSIYPDNSTLDAFIGGIATTSAKFAFLNVNNGTPTASVAGSLANVSTFIDGNGNLSTTNRQDLVLGNSATYNSTGNILLNPNGTGNVGVGTSNPSTPLNVVGTIRAENSTTAYVDVYSTAAVDSIYRWATNNVMRWSMGVDHSDATKLMISTGSNLASPKFTVDTSGNVGIATTSPDRKLEVFDDTNPQLRLSQTDSTTYADFQMDSNGDLIMNVDGQTNQLVLDNGGHVGIGTTAPLQKLSIQQDAAADLFGIYDGANNNSLLLADGGTATFKPSAFDYAYNCSNGATANCGSGVYTDNSAEAKTIAGTPFTVLADNNDEFYVGLDHKFATVYFDFAAPLTGTAPVLATQYYNGSWSALTVTDNTSAMTQDGSITFTAPSNWTTTAINGQTKYWVRFSITYSGLSTAPTAYSVSPTTGSRFYVYGQSGDTYPALYVNDKGNVGMGNVSPSYKLDVSGVVGANYYVDNDNPNYGIDPAGTTNFGGYSLKVTGGALLAYDSGKVGVGNQTPTGKLDVKGFVPGKALTILDELGDQAIFTASASGVSRFTINNEGSVTLYGIQSAATTIAGTIYFDVGTVDNSGINKDDPHHLSTGDLYLFGQDAAWHRIALDMTKYTSTAANITNQSYIEIAHNQSTFDISLTGWVKDTLTNLWKSISNFTTTVKRALNNEFNPEFTQKQKVTSVTLNRNQGNFGTGNDGAISIAGTTNINTQNAIAGRSCADGGDAVNYSVSAFAGDGTYVDLTTSPSYPSCINVDDEVLIINLQGSWTSTNPNLGNWETLRVQSVTGSRIYFKTAKTKYYGGGVSDDSGIGTTNGTQRVMLQRVPNYTNVTIGAAGNFAPSAYNSTKGGVMFFRATGTVSVAGGGILHSAARGWQGGATYSTWYGGNGG
ncbi:MAG: phage integrase SAM-like domain-containing protein, partial [Patescibacteria group bacterium]